MPAGVRGRGPGDPRHRRGRSDAVGGGGGRLWTDGTLPNDILTSLQRAGTGFTIGLAAGIVLALVSGLTRTGETLIDGSVQLNRAVPTLGLIPLFILWLGIGETFKVAIIAIVVYIPIYLNTHSALSGIDHRFVELAEVQGLSRIAFIRQVVVPGTLPGFFVGLRLGLAGAGRPGAEPSRPTAARH